MNCRNQAAAALCFGVLRWFHALSLVAGDRPPGLGLCRFDYLEVTLLL
jgi:hypothetical protein